MIVKLQDLHALTQIEIKLVKMGENVDPTYPAWMKGYVMRRVRLEEQRAQREAQRGDQRV